MNADEIRKLLHAKPVRPFFVRMAAGGRLLVKHKDFAALAPGGRAMLVYRHDRSSDYHVVDLPLVTRYEVPG